MANPVGTLSEGDEAQAAPLPGEGEAEVVLLAADCVPVWPQREAPLPEPQAMPLPEAPVTTPLPEAPLPEEDETQAMPLPEAPLTILIPLPEEGEAEMAPLSEAQAMPLPEREAHAAPLPEEQVR